MNSDDHKVSEVEPPRGCLNCTIQISALKGFRCNPILRELGDSVLSELAAIGASIDDLKMTLASEVDVIGVATLNFARDKSQLTLGAELDEPVERGRLHLSLRANAKPDHLHAAVTRAMNHTWGIFPQIFARLSEMEHFRPVETSPV